MRGRRGGVLGCDDNICRILQTKGEFVPADMNLDRIPHRGDLTKRHFGAGNQPHVNQSVTERALAAYGDNDGRFSHPQLIQSHKQLSFPDFLCPSP